MEIITRDNEQLIVIMNYCKRIESAFDYFGGSYEIFCAESVYQDSCSLCLIQIGEAVHRLSDEFKLNHPQIEWARIYGMRCRLMHGYEEFDSEIVWDSIENDLPPLKAFCEERICDC